MKIRHYDKKNQADIEKLIKNFLNILGSKNSPGILNSGLDPINSKGNYTEHSLEK